MSTTPNIDRVLPYLEKWGRDHDAGFVLNDGAVGYADFAKEVRSLLTPAPVERRLRRYRNIEYNPTLQHWVDVPRAGDCGIRYVYHSAWEAVARNVKRWDFTEKDRDALEDLRAHPYEPVETVKDALIAFTQEWNVAFDNELDLVIDTFTHRLRAAVAAEQGGAE